MKEFLLWISSVVAAAVLINLASDYVKMRIGNILARYSKARATLNEERARPFEQEVQTLLNDRLALVDLKLDMLRCGLRAILVGVMYLAGAVFIAALPAIFRAFGNLLPISVAVRQLMMQSATFSAVVALLILSLFVSVILIDSISRWRSASILLRAYSDRRTTSKDSEAALVVHPRYGDSR